MTEPRMQHRAMSGSVALQQPGSVVHITAKGCVNTWDLGLRLMPCWSLRNMLQLKPYRSEWLALPQVAMVTSQARLLLRTMSGSMTLLQLGSALMSVVPDSIEGCANARGLIHH